MVIILLLLLSCIIQVRLEIIVNIPLMAWGNQPSLSSYLYHNVARDIYVRQHLHTYVAKLKINRPWRAVNNALSNVCVCVGAAVYEV